MPPPIAITACSLLTPLDETDRSTWNALRAGETIRSRFAVDDAILPAEPGLDRSLRLAIAVVQRFGNVPADAGIFCGTSKGPVGTFLEALACLDAGHALSREQAAHIAQGVGAMGSVLQQRLHTRGPVHTSVAACASGIHALHRAARAIERGECPSALVVAADASLQTLFNASFHRLGVLSPRDPDGSPRCRPFAESGEGFFLIEAAAAILLEQRPAAARPPLAWLEATWTGGDGTGLIAIDPRTHGLRAGLHHLCPPRADLAFVHAHATGTAHDAFEFAAIRHSIPPHVPVFSHKQWLGHSLGAAGLLGVTLSILSHVHGETPGGATVPAGAASLTIAQGFGGHIGLVRFRGDSEPAPSAPLVR